MTSNRRYLIRHAGFLAALGATALLGGCVAPGPTYPLMTPIQVAHVFGYDDHPVDGNKLEVSYVTPSREYYGYRLDPSPAERQAKDMAFDLASLRAAELAKQAGWDGFNIVDQHSSSDQEYLGPWPGYGYGYYGPYFHHHRFGFYGPGWDDYYEPPRDQLQAQVKLTVEFVRDVKPGQYRAADVITQVLARYPGAELTPVVGPVQPMPAPPAAAQPTPAPGTSPKTAI